MSAILYRAMLAKVKALLRIETAHNKEERSAQQWQLFFEIDGIQFIVGKGGVNTMFYSVGKGDRVLCYPEELLTFLEELVHKKYSSYAICDSSGKVLRSGLMSEEEALKKKAPVGSFIIAYGDGKRFRLYVRQTGLFKEVWKPFTPAKRK